MIDQDELPQADIKPIKRISRIWLIPLVAAFIGLWMIYYAWDNQGPLITITFQNADGMEVDSTKIKLRDITVGKVVDLALTDDFKAIVVTARLNKNTEALLSKNTKFWVVKPRIGKSGVSGLGTLLSGDYIKISPGDSKERTNEFTGLDAPPITPFGTPGIHITLNSDDEFAFSPGDPIVYKGLTVGNFEDVYFNFDERVVYYNAFINAPYHQLITENTRFWNVSGVKVDMQADGISMQIGNLETLVTNGATFGVPEGMPRGKAIEEREYFKIYPTYEAASAARYKSYVDYVVLVSDSIRGLHVGAPVEYRGIKLGEVAATNIHIPDHSKLLDDAIKIPVLIRLHPGRVGLPDDQVGVENMRKQNRHWIERGLKASLRTGNLLTGSLFIELQHYNKPAEKIEEYGEYTVIPTIEDRFSQITKKASVFMDNLNQVPLKELSGDASKLMQELTETVKSFKGSSDEITGMVKNAKDDELTGKIASLLEQMTKLTADFSEGSTTYTELNNSLRLMQSALHELRPLLKQVKDKPNSLIFNDGVQEEIEPKAYQQEKED